MENFLETFGCGSNYDCKGFNMIYDSTQNDDYLWYLIFRGKQKKT